jgi:hypothetical protein
MGAFDDRTECDRTDARRSQKLKSDPTPFADQADATGWQKVK